MKSGVVLDRGGNKSMLSVNTKAFRACIFSKMICGIVDKDKERVRAYSKSRETSMHQNDVPQDVQKQPRALETSPKL